MSDSEQQLLEQMAKLQAELKRANEVLAIYGQDSDIESRYRFESLKSEVMCKAAGDPFTYAMGLITGEVFYFEELSDAGNFVLLKNPVRVGPWIGSKNPKNFSDHEPTFDRGVEISKAAIAWVCDAPWGS